MTHGRRRHALLFGLVLSAVAATEGLAIAADPSKAMCLSASAEWANLREDHKLRSARDQLLLCAATSCPTDIREECSRHIPELSAAIPSIVFAAKDGSGNDLAAVTVTMDGKPLLTKLDGSSIAIDPGQHTFRFEALGQTPVEKAFVIQEGEKERRERIEFGSGAPLKAAEPPPQSPTAMPSLHTPTSEPPAPPQAPPSEGALGSGLGRQKILGLVAGGVGVAGVVVGSVFGLMASSKWSTAKSDCGAGCGPNDRAQTEKSDANGMATTATIAFVAGGVLVGTGLALYLTAPKNSTTEAVAVRVAPSIGPGVTGLNLVGSF